MNDDYPEGDYVGGLETDFCFPDLLETGFFESYKQEYYHRVKTGWQLKPRNYRSLLICLSECFQYNLQHAKSFRKRFISDQDQNNLEGVFSELIVYRHYIRHVYERNISAIHIRKSEADVILERLDGTRAYLEVFCVMPNLRMPEGDEVVVGTINTHSQTHVSSIRQKILRKINKQKQLTQKREYYVVVDLNESLISGDHAILSSLIGSYQYHYNADRGMFVNADFDTSHTLFDEPGTENIKGVIYFDEGGYEFRKIIHNYKFGTKQSS